MFLCDINDLWAEKRPFPPHHATYGRGVSQKYFGVFVKGDEYEKDV